MKSFFLFSCLLVFVALVHGNAVMDCTYTDSNSGLFYNLTSLALDDNLPLSQYYYYNDTTGNAAGNYILNICNSVNTARYCAEGTGVCQITQTGTDYSCGIANSTYASFSDYGGSASNNSQGVQLTYTNGQFCNGVGAARRTIINIGCDEGSEPYITSVSEDQSCVYTIQMWADAGCALNGNTSTLSPSASMSASPSPNATSPTPSSSVSFVNATSASASASVSVYVSVSVSVSGPVTNSSMSPSASPSQVQVNGTSLSPVASVNSTSVTVTVSISTNTTVAGNNSTTITPSNSASVSGSGTSPWIWWVLASMIVVVMVAVALIAGFVVYKKRQQTHAFDPIEYE